MKSWTLFIGFLSLTPFGQAQSILGTNLIVNGNAEAGPAGTGLTNIAATVPGWTTRTGNADVIPYNVTGLLQLTQQAPPDHSFQFFVAGAATSTLSQDIDISSVAGAVSNGGIEFSASAYLGSVCPSDYQGTAQMAVSFKNAAGQTFNTTTLGPYPTGAFTNRGYSRLLLQQQLGLVPSGTARITVVLTLTSFNGGYGAADSLSLVLNPISTSATSVLGPNLVANPGAEAGPGSAEPVPALYIPGWSNLGGSVAPYGGPNWIGPSDPGPSDRGVNVFSAGTGNIYQDLDVSAASTLIDTGKVTYQVSAWLGGVGSSASPNITYTFTDWTGKQLAATAQLGPAAHNGTGLVPTSQSNSLPAGTRLIHLVLTFPASGSLADDISFTLAPAGSPVITPSGIVPVFSSGTTVAPGSWVSIYGTNLASATTVWNGDFPTSLGGVSVTVDSKPAYLWFVSPTQINLQVPDDSTTGVVSVVVTTPSGSATGTVTLGQYGPAFSLFNGKYAAAIVILPVGKGGNTGAGYDLIGPTGALSFVTRPVKVGETIILFGVGFGPTNPAVPAGQAFSGAANLVTLPLVTIGNVSAQVTFGGIVQGGLYQFNVIVPNVGSGDKLLQATAGGITTPANVYIALQ